MSTHREYFIGSRPGDAVAMTTSSAAVDRAVISEVERSHYQAPGTACRWHLLQPISLQHLADVTDGTALKYRLKIYFFNKSFPP